jgi:hypothetical protein
MADPLIRGEAWRLRLAAHLRRRCAHYAPASVLARWRAPFVVPRHLQRRADLADFLSTL